MNKSQIARQPRRAASVPVTEAHLPKSGRLASRTDHDLHIPLSSQAVFWRPRYVVDSPLLGQIPFLFWLMETSRPSTILQLGLGDGVAYMALCQAGERLDNSTVCFGFDTQDPPLPPQALAKHDEEYSDFSVLVHSEFSVSALPTETPIDLLVINRPLDREMLTDLRRDLLPRLSESAVIVLCQPQEALDNAMVRQILVGDGAQHVSLGPVTPGSYMLELILSGPAQPERLRVFASQQPGRPAWLAARQVFNRLGQAIVSAAQQRVSQAENKALRRALEERSANMQRQEAEIEKSLREIAEVRALEAEQVSRQAELSAQLYDAQRALACAESACAAATMRAEDIERQLRVARSDHKATLSMVEVDLAAARATAESHVATEARTQATAVALRRQVEALEAELGAVRAEHEARVGDIAALTARFQQEAEAAARASGEAAGLRLELDTLQGERQALEAELGAVRAEHEARVGDIAALTARFQQEAEAASARASGEAAGLRLELDTLQGERQALEAELGAVRAEHEARVGDIAALTARFQQEAEAASARASGEAAGLRLELDTLQGERQALEAELGAVRAEHEARVGDIAALTARFQQEAEAAARASEEVKTLRSDLDSLKAERQKLFQQLEQVEAHRDDLLSSTSWRITGPLRRVRLAVTRR